MFYKSIAKRIPAERNASLKRVILIDFVSVTSLFSLVYITVSLVIGFEPGIVAMCGNLVLNLFILFAFLKNKTNYSQTADLFIGNACLVAILPCTFYSGGPVSPVLAWFLLVPIVSLLLHGLKKATYFWLTVALFFMVLFCLCGIFGIKFPQDYDLSWYGRFYLMCIVGLAGIVFLVTMIFEKEKDRAMLIVQKKNEEITDSINYAKHLQEAILPPHSEIRSHLKNSFILFEPKDVVSGDFYWYEKVGNVSYIAAADCTGHGVPGAMLSVVCSNALDRSVKEFGITEPSEILDKTRALVIETFAKGGGDIKDGMDIALCAIEGNKATFCGANNPLWIIRKKELLTQEQIEDRTTVVEGDNALIVYKANRQAISFNHAMTNFTQQQIELHPGDKLYCFSDGFVDQFGGEKGKKFKYKPFKQFLLNLHETPMPEQRKILLETFHSWKGDFEQTDDICIIGIGV